ncbi:MAG TPA: hypothetical protein VNA87_02370 [Actinomycetota bacterium]|nr:hypothetical protein [Actinomycetota bacterium]
MSLRTLPRTAVDIYLRAARMPFDAVIRGSGGRLMVDRADTKARRFAGRILGDDVLIDDAERRQLAASKRERALRLETKAEATTREAEEKLASNLLEVESQRSTAEKRAQEQKERATRLKTAEQRRAAEIAAKRKSVVQAQEAKAEERIHEREARERLTQLEKKALALDERDAALTARREAQRLKQLASKSKQNRKKSR